MRVGCGSKCLLNLGCRNRFSRGQPPALKSSLPACGNSRSVCLPHLCPTSAWPLPNVRQVTRPLGLAGQGQEPQPEQDAAALAVSDGLAGPPERWHVRRPPAAAILPSAVHLLRAAARQAVRMPRCQAWAERRLQPDRSGCTGEARA